MFAVILCFYQNIKSMVTHKKAKIKQNDIICFQNYPLPIIFILGIQKILSYKAASQTKQVFSCHSQNKLTNKEMKSKNVQKQISD